jgi:N-acetylneuraminic acid mutarotase
VAGAVLGSTFFVLGGRSDRGATARRGIWAVDTRTGRVRAAGRLPVALSDAAAITVGKRILVVGGRTASGSVSDRVWELALR